MCGCGMDRVKTGCGDVEWIGSKQDVECGMDRFQTICGMWSGYDPNRMWDVEWI
jgi:hypothetical protein